MNTTGSCKTAWLAVGLALAILLAGGAGGAGATLNGADVAIYTDAIAPAGQQGVWQTGVTAIESMLTWQGLTYEEITYLDLNSSPQNFSNLYKVMIVPGGDCAYYQYWISEAGKNRIRNFVNNGGGYLGICAGAYFAMDRIVYYDKLYEDNFYTNAYGELTGYDLDLVAGVATGPMNEIADYGAGNYAMVGVDFTTANSVLAGYKTEPYTEDILYFGGPRFSLDTGATAQALAYYFFNEEPGVIAGTYGSGKVVLFGPHPEIEEDSTRDGTTFGKALDDTDTDWRLMKYVMSWLGATDASMGSGSYSRYDFTYYFADGSGDYYGGYVYAPTAFKTSGPIISVGTNIYYQPMELWASYQSLNGGYYRVTAITDGYDASYDKQSYIYWYYDANSAIHGFAVNADGSRPLAYVDARLHLLNRTASFDAGYAVMGVYPNTADYFSNYYSADLPVVPAGGAPGYSPSNPTTAVWTAYWRQSASLRDEER